MKTKLLFLLVFAFALFSLKAQTSLNFDGVNDYVLGTNNNSLDLTQGTLEAWIKTDNAGSEWRAIINKQEAFGIYLYDNKLAIWDMGNWNGIYTTVNLADNIWHHVAFTFQSEVVNGSKLYIDGNPVLTFTYKISHFDRTIAVGNGKDDASISQFFNGEIDQVRVWNTVRTDAEILANYNKCLLGNESGLVMYWNFDEGTGTSVTDLSGNNNNGTLTNMDAATDWVNGYDCSLVAYYPFNGNANDESGNANHGTVNGATLTTDRNGNLERAYSFDGVDDYIQCLKPGPLGNASRSIVFWAKTNYVPNEKAGNVVLTYGVNPESYDYGGRFDIEINSKIVGLGFEVAGGEFANAFDNTDNQWHFYAVVFDNTVGLNLTDGQLYADGNLLTNRTYYNNVNPIINTKADNPIHIGKLFNYSNVNFKGSLDDIQIYNRALTATEILNLYNYNTLKVEKIENVANSTFYVFNNTLYFKNTQNLNEIKTIEVYNLLAQQVFKTSDIQEQIELTTLQKGVYILKVENSNNHLSTLKFIIK